MAKETEKNLTFDEQEASKFGLNAAFLLQNIRFWLKKNLEKKRNINQEKVWMYCSIRQFSEQFSFMSKKQIRHGLQKLLEAGVIVKSNFNKTHYDRTLWYSINETDYLLAKNEKTLINQHLPFLANGCDKIGKPIPYRKHILHNKQTISTTCENETIQKVEKNVKKLSLIDLIKKLQKNLARSCVPLEYIKERAKYFYEKYKNFHIFAIAKMICADWKKSHPKKPKKAVKQAKINQNNQNVQEKKSSKIDTSSWFKRIYTQLSISKSNESIAKEKLQEYLDFGNYPSFSGAKMFVERGLILIENTRQRLAKTTKRLDDEHEKRLKQIGSITPKTTFEKLNDTSWANDKDWFEQFV